MESTQKYDVIILVIDVDAIYYDVTKRSRFGAPTRIELRTDDYSCVHSLYGAYSND